MWSVLLIYAGLFASILVSILVTLFIRFLRRNKEIHFEIPGRASGTKALYLPPHHCVIHKWEVERHTTVHCYFQCSKCQGRKIVRYPMNLAQPCTTSWVKTGEFSKARYFPKQKLAPLKKEI